MKTNLTTTQWVIQILHENKGLKSREIAIMISHRTGVEVSPSQVSSTLSRLSDPDKCNLGHFIHRTREGNAMIYRLVEEAKEMPLEMFWGLAIKTGENAVDLDTVMEKFPHLQKYLRRPLKRAENALKIEKRTPKATDRLVEFGRVAPEIDSGSADRKVNVSFRYSSRYALSVTASFPTFVMVCCALIATFFICCVIAYSFFFSIFVTLLLFGFAMLGLYAWHLHQHRY